MAAFARRGPEEPVSRVEIQVSCNGLKNMDVTSKSDPCCVLYMQQDGASWQEVSD